MMVGDIDFSLLLKAGLNRSAGRRTRTSLSRTARVEGDQRIADVAGVSGQAGDHGRGSHGDDLDHGSRGDAQRRVRLSADMSADDARAARGVRYAFPRF